MAKLTNVMWCMIVVFFVVFSPLVLEATSPTYVFEPTPAEVATSPPYVLEPTPAQEATSPPYVFEPTPIEEATSPIISLDLSTASRSTRVSIASCGFGLCKKFKCCRCQPEFPFLCISCCTN
ncbi:uncharacterized protein LOC132600048 [Lycium barbarum]|uniref:uncharacterized protein LOC132600048 n=1 Tax=Lycium barbarum TaxID=112863 RepID=UPI00293E5BAC|nr:uncharacterized protein LOC132600048 [Lycium barbarum]